MARRQTYPVAPYQVLQAGLLTGKYTSFDIRTHNLELLQQHLDAGAGCILLGSHIGSFEVLRALGVCRHRIPVKILMLLVMRASSTVP